MTTETHSQLAGFFWSICNLMQAIEERDWLEIVIPHAAPNDIRRRLDQYGLFDRQLFPDLEGLAKWLRCRVLESRGTL